MKRLKRREKQEEHIDSEGSWAISYGDMITLLLAFFVLYFSIDPKEKREQELEEALLLNLTEVGSKKSTKGQADKEGAAGKAAAEALAKLEGKEITSKSAEGEDEDTKAAGDEAAGKQTAGIEKAGEEAAGKEAAGIEKAGKEAAQDMLKESGKELGSKSAAGIAAGEAPSMVAGKEIGSDSKGTPLNIGLQPGENIEDKLLKDWGAQVFKVGKKIVVDFPGVSFFQLGYIRPNKQGKTILEEFAKSYLPFAGSYLLDVRAFTDSRPVRKGGKRVYQDNLELSTLRAINSMRILQNAGIPLRRMHTGGFGELKLTKEHLVDHSKKYKDPMALARKVVLIIEPAPKEGEL